MRRGGGMSLFLLAILFLATWWIGYAMGRFTAPCAEPWPLFVNQPRVRQEPKGKRRGLSYDQLIGKPSPLEGGQALAEH